MMRFRSRILAAILRAFERTGRLRFLAWPSSDSLGLLVELSQSWNVDLGLPSSSPWSSKPSSTSSSDISDPATLLQLIVPVTWTKLSGIFALALLESASYKCGLCGIVVFASGWTVLFCQVFRIRCCSDNLGILLLRLLRCLVITRSSTRQVDLLFKACEVTWYSHLSGMTCSPTPGLWVSYRQITPSPPPPLTLSHTHYRIIQKCFNTSHQSNMYAKHINYLKISIDFTLPLTPLQVDFIPFHHFVIP